MAWSDAARQAAAAARKAKRSGYPNTHAVMRSGSNIKKVNLGQKSFMGAIKAGMTQLTKMK